MTVNKNPQGPVSVLGVATAEFLLWRGALRRMIACETAPDPRLPRMSYPANWMSLKLYSDFSNLRYLAMSFLSQPDASRSRHSFA